MGNKGSTKDHRFRNIFYRCLLASIALTTVLMLFMTSSVTGQAGNDGKKHFSNQDAIKLIDRILKETKSDEERSSVSKAFINKRSELKEEKLSSGKKVKELVIPDVTANSGLQCGTPFVIETITIAKVADEVNQTGLLTDTLDFFAEATASLDEVKVTTHFEIHYTKNGTDATTDDFAQKVADDFEKSYQTEITDWGYRAGDSDILWGKYQVEIRAIADAGVTHPGLLGLSSIEINKDIVTEGDEYILGTVAHEYHHASENRYAFLGDGKDNLWLIEGSATSMEYDVFRKYYPTVSTGSEIDWMRRYFNQFLTTPYQAVSNERGSGGYASGIYFHFVADNKNITFGSSGEKRYAVRRIWENLELFGWSDLNSAIDEAYSGASSQYNSFEKSIIAFARANRFQSNWYPDTDSFLTSVTQETVNLTDPTNVVTKTSGTGTVYPVEHYAAQYFTITLPENYEVKIELKTSGEGPLSSVYPNFFLKVYPGGLESKETNVTLKKASGNVTVLGDKTVVVLGRLNDGGITGTHSGNFQLIFKVAPIGQGLRYLKHTQNASDGSWSSNVGITSLATLSFLNAGYEESDQTVQKAIQYILNSRHPDGSICRDCGHVTYETGLAILALKGTHNPDYADDILAARTWLVDSQWDDNSSWGAVSESHPYWGGFGYGRNSRPDLSNTQFVAMALDAADLPKSDPTWAKMVKYASRCQNLTASNDGYSTNNDGGFNYTPGSSVAGGTLSIGSTTGAGMWTLALGGIQPTDNRFAAALRWEEQNYSWDYNPPAGGNWSTGMQYYYYLSMSKSLTMARKTTIGGFFGIGAHDWYKELSSKLETLQYADGSWKNYNNWVWETDNRLTTSYSLLSLQTRKLPANADLEMVIILHSPADIHLYDEDGNHVGKNYDTGEVNTQISGSSYDPGDPQTIRVHPPAAGNYHLSLVGTGEGEYTLEIIGLQDGNQVSYSSFTGNITVDAVQGTDLNVGAFDGGLTILGTEPRAVPVMDVEPKTLNLDGQPGNSALANLKINEKGGSESIQSVGLIASDLVNANGDVISGDTINFDPSNFDLPANGSQDVEVNIPIPADALGGTYTGIVTAESMNAGAKSIQVTLQVVTNKPPKVSVDPLMQTVQYSDPIISVVYSVTDDAQDIIQLVSTSWEEGGATHTGLPNGLAISEQGCAVEGSTQKCVWGLAGKADLAPSTYLITLDFADDKDAHSSGQTTILVTTEDARGTYTGPMMVSTSSASISTATVPLRATIQDITAVDPGGDPNPGDIRNANVTFVNRDNNSLLCIANLVLLDPNDLKTASASCDWMANIGASTGQDYTVGVVVAGYYTRNSSEDDTVVVVSKPGTNFITGGGYLINQASSGKYAGDVGAKTNFGINLKFNNKLTNLQGRVNIIIRQNGHVYQIKSNTLNSLVAVPALGKAELLTKANIQDITDPMAPVALEGAATLQVVMKDNGEPGNKDTISISVWSKDGKLLFSSNWTGTKTIPQIITGGNIQVH